MTDIGTEWDLLADLPFGEEQCRALMRRLSGERAPRRFGLWYPEPDWSDAELVGWGYSDGEDATLDLPRQYHRLPHRNLTHRLRMLSLHPIWVDPEPTPMD